MQQIPSLVDICLDGARWITNTACQVFVEPYHMLMCSCLQLVRKHCEYLFRHNAIVRNKQLDAFDDPIHNLIILIK